MKIDLSNSILMGNIEKMPIASNAEPATDVIPQRAARWGHAEELQRNYASHRKTGASWMRRSLQLTVCAGLLVLCWALPGYSQTFEANLPIGNPGAVAVNPVTNKAYVVNDVDGGLVAVIDGATDTTSSIRVGDAPTAIAINPITNKIYVVNYLVSTVTVIDGATDTTTTVAVGRMSRLMPGPIAVNPVTNKIYVANTGDDTVSVIDGASNTVTNTIAIGPAPVAIALNPVTNKIYVAQQLASGTVTVIDGATNTTTTVAAGNLPSSLAVNPVTNKIYVANICANGSGCGSPGTVTVIDGATNTTTILTAGPAPNDVALNLVTNKIYVTNSNDTSMTVIDGVTNMTITVSTGDFGTAVAVAVNTVTNQIYVTDPQESDIAVIDGVTNNITVKVHLFGMAPRNIALNPVTNKVYVSNAFNGVAVIDGAINVVTAAEAGTEPIALAVNPVTNQAYVTNFMSDDVTVIDGQTGATTTVPAGSSPDAVAINSLTNRIYVADYYSNDVKVIDGSTNTVTATVAVGINPNAVAVNTVTNQIYVVNHCGSDPACNSPGTVTIVDGTTNSASTVSTGMFPLAIAINSMTNKIYVANSQSANVTVIDGATAATTTVAAGAFPSAVGILSTINQIYVANLCGTDPTCSSGGTVTVIDGATNTTSSIAVGMFPDTAVTNPITNNIYVANSGDNTVTVINGLFNATTTVRDLGTNPAAIAVNPVTNIIYVADEGSGHIEGIDGITNYPIAYGLAGMSPVAVAVNPITNQVYVANESSNNVTILTEQNVQPIPLIATIMPFSGNVTTDLTPAFFFSASSTFSPIAPPVDGLYFQTDTWEGPWAAATSGGGGNFSGTVATPLSLGAHILYAYATDGQDATSTVTGLGQDPLVGAISAYFFVVRPQASLQSIITNPMAPTIDAGDTIQFTATGVYSDGSMQDLTNSVVWASSVASVASIAKSGLATGIGRGKTAISATLGNIVGSTTLAVQAPVVTLKPSSLKFGNQNVGQTSAAQNVTLTNSGNGTLSIDKITVNGDFAQTNNCGSTVQAGANCTFSVTFTPTQEGARNGTLTITDNASPGSQTVKLTGTGLAPLVTLSPASLAFGNHKVGTMSQPKNITLKNTGNATLQITSIAISGKQFSETNTCGTSVGPGKSCTIGVVFAPTVKGLANATVIATDNASPGTQTVALTGTGT